MTLEISLTQNNLDCLELVTAPSQTFEVSYADCDNLVPMLADWTGAFTIAPEALVRCPFDSCGLYLNSGSGSGSLDT